MDENEILSKAAEELTREGDIEAVRAELTSQGAESFPTLLFIANVMKDIVDFPVDLTSPTGFTWFLYIVLIAGPVFLGNTFYMWGKLSWLRRKTIAGGASIGTKILVRRYEKVILRRLAFMGITSLIPIVNMIFPQCIFILLAHKRHNKFVAAFLEAVDIYAEAARTGNYRAVAAAAQGYAGRAAANVIRAANVSGRVGSRFGENARRGAQRLEGNVVRSARQQGGRLANQATRQLGQGRAPSGPAEAVRRDAAPGEDSQGSPSERPVA